VTDTPQNPRRTPESERKKISADARQSLVQTEKNRDASGRFVSGNSGGPGRPPKDPTFRELCAAQRDRNIAYLISVRDDPKADPELRFEAVKLMVAYDAGKPVTVASGPLVSIDLRTGERPPLPADLTPTEAFLLLQKQPERADEYLAIIRGQRRAQAGTAVIEHEPLSDGGPQSAAQAPPGEDGSE